MTPEKNNRNNSSINTEAWSHTGKLEGELQELPLTEDAPSVQEVTTGEIPQIVPNSSSELVFEEHEIGPFQEKLAGLRESHATATPEAGQDIQTGKRISLGKKIGASATVLALAVGGYFGIKAATESNAGPTPSETSTGQTEQPNDNGGRPMFNFESNTTYKSLTAEQRDKINPLLYMGVNEFVNETDANRYALGTLLRDTYQDWALVKAKENQGSQKMTLPETVPVISLQSTGQDIVDDVAIKRCAQWYSLTITSGGAPGSLQADRNNAVKMESLVSLPDTPRYEFDVNKLTTATSFENKFMCSTDMTVEKESPVITTPDGVRTKVMQGSNLSGEQVQQEFIYQEFPDYTGKVRPNWVMTDTITKQNSDPSAWIPDVTKLQ